MINVDRDIKLIISNNFKKKLILKKMDIFYIVAKIKQVCNVNREKKFVVLMSQIINRQFFIVHIFYKNIKSILISRFIVWYKLFTSIYLKVMIKLLFNFKKKIMRLSIILIDDILVLFKLLKIYQNIEIIKKT